MDHRVRPKSDFLKIASFEELHKLATHWKSALQFDADEAAFLQNLIEKHFVWLIDSNRSDRIQSLTEKLAKSQREVKSLRGWTEMHLVHLDELMENTFSHDEQQFRDDHTRLEEKLYRFWFSFKKLKSDIYEICEKGIQQEKLRYLGGT